MDRDGVRQLENRLPVVSAKFPLPEVVGDACLSAELYVEPIERHTPPSAPEGTNDDSDLTVGDVLNHAIVLGPVMLA